MARTPNFGDIKDRAAVIHQGIPAMGEAKKGSQCYRVAHGGGSAYYSYSTCIALVDHDACQIVLNTTRYSATTNRFVDMLSYELPAMYQGYTVHRVAGLFNATPNQLLDLAEGTRESAGDRPEDLVDMRRRDRRINYLGWDLGPKRGRSTLI
jgi:hypothetical protein